MGEDGLQNQLSCIYVAYVSGSHEAEFSLKLLTEKALLRVDMKGTIFKGFLLFPLFRFLSFFERWHSYMSITPSTVFSLTVCVWLGEGTVACITIVIGTEIDTCFVSVACALHMVYNHLYPKKQKFCPTLPLTQPYTMDFL